MSTEIINEHPTAKTRRRGRRRLGGRVLSGIILIVVGALALLAQFVDVESTSQLILPGLGIIFLIGGILAKSGGLLIPGGILTGIGVGAFLTAGPFIEYEESAQTGIFLLSFAGGWGVITLLSLIFARPTIWWALIPGVVLGIIGGSMVIGGTTLELMTTIGRFWPVLLILFGVYIIFRRRG